MNQKPLITFLITIVLAGILSAGLYAFFDCSEDWCGNGSAAQNNSVTSYAECVKAGFLVMQIQDGSAQCRTSDGRVFLEKGAAQSSVSSHSNSAPVQKNITVSVPKAGDIVGKTFEIQGMARVFESTLNYRVKDEDGSVLAQGNTMAAALDVGLFGPYTVQVDASKAKGKNGTVEVFSESAADGSEINMVKVPIIFKK